MGEVEDRLIELESHKNEEVVVICRSGMRSQKIAVMLQRHGFQNVSNLVGGINRWAKDVDPSLPIY
jgi:adenylyltransferase/sulfurtransferase